MSRPRVPMSIRFWNMVDQRGPDECWLWKGYKQWKGYGSFKPWSGRTLMAHRVAWVMTRGPIPEGLYVLHRCGTRECVNPAHLYLANAEQAGRIGGIEASTNQREAA